MAAAGTHAAMPKALCIAAMAISGLVGLIFLADLAISVPFSGTSHWMMGIVFVMSAAITGFLAWSTFREQK